MSPTTKAATCCLLAIAFAFVVSETAVAGKPAPPPTVPVEYQLSWVDGGDTTIEATTLGSINDQGVVVGRAFPIGTFYAQVPGTYGYAICWKRQTGMQRLDDLSGVWIDLDLDPPGQVTGWSATTASDINESGQIAGTARYNNDGAIARAFVFYPEIGFYLLPTTAGAGRYVGTDINDNGDVLGTYYENGDYALNNIFLWTPLRPGQLDLPLPGLYAHDGIQAVFTNTYLAAWVKDENASIYAGLDWKLYSVSVSNEGVVPSLNSELSMVYTLGFSSRNHLLPFISRTYKRGLPIYNLAVYNATTRTTTTLAPSDWRGVGNANTSSDITFDDQNGAMRLYRKAENTTYRVYDLMNADAKTQVDAGGYTFGGRKALVNDSNAGIAPVSSPFDEMAAEAWPTTNDVNLPRVFVLTPVLK